jgi:hypothetical protein
MPRIPNATDEQIELLGDYLENELNRWCDVYNGPRYDRAADAMEAYVASCGELDRLRRLKPKVK